MQATPAFSFQKAFIGYGEPFPAVTIPNAGICSFHGEPGPSLAAGQFFFGQFPLIDVDAYHQKAGTISDGFSPGMVRGACHALAVAVEDQSRFVSLVDT